MGVYRGDVFKVDWTNKEEVIKVAKALGKSQSVIKYPGRDNYNITHTERANKLPGVKRVFDTGED